MDQRIIDYIKNGLAQGYSTWHIRDLLIRHGHSPRTVDNAIAFIRYSTPDSKVSVQVPEQPHERPKVRSYGARNNNMNKVAITAGVLVIMMVCSVLIISLFDRKDQEITGLATQVDQVQTQNTANLQTLEAQKSQIEEQIRVINSLNISVADKDRLLNEQIGKLASVNKQIDQERQDTRDMLLEQANYILQKK